MQVGVWDKMMRGLTTRNYGAVAKNFQDAYGYLARGTCILKLEWWKVVGLGTTYFSLKI